MSQYNLYFYRVATKRVLDGDTVELNFDLGFCATLAVQVRLAGYDAPETYRPKCDAEKQAGLKVTDHLKQLIAQYEGNLYCHSTNIDLYGRAEGVLYYKDSTGSFVSINDMINKFMIDNHLTKAEARALCGT